jgi:hypothetical protein
MAAVVPPNSPPEPPPLSQLAHCCSPPGLPTLLALQRQLLLQPPSAPLAPLSPPPAAPPLRQHWWESAFVGLCIVAVAGVLSMGMGVAFGRIGAQQRHHPLRPQSGKASDHFRGNKARRFGRAGRFERVRNDGDDGVLEAASAMPDLLPVDNCARQP